MEVSAAAAAAAAVADSALAATAASAGTELAADETDPEAEGGRNRLLAEPDLALTDL